jgi:hypothetical protein
MPLATRLASEAPIALGKDPQLNAGARNYTMTLSGPEHVDAFIGVELTGSGRAKCAGVSQRVKRVPYVVVDVTGAIEAVLHA